MVYNHDFRPVVPMKYYSTKDNELLKNALESNEYGIQKKVDGASYTFTKNLDGTVHCYGDKISKKTGEIIDKIDNIPHIKHFLDEELPAGSMLVAEVWTNYDYGNNQFVKRELSSFVNSIMLANPDKAIDRQSKTQVLQMYVFDILWWDNQAYYDRPFEERDKALKDIFEEFNWEGKYQWICKAETYYENKSEKIAEWLANGFEGGVLKKKTAFHQIAEIGSSAKRPAHATYKIKTVDTCDVVIMGVEHPDKEYKGKNADTYEYRDEEGNPVNRLWYLGMINAFVIGAYENGELKQIGTIASGLDDNIRKDAADNTADYIGKVIECECMSIDKVNHSIRHPRLLYVRPEKNATDCTFEHIFG